MARTRKLALFEGMDDRGRLQPLLGTAEPTVDVMGNVQNGALVWDECQAPITENAGLDDVEIWEVYNATEVWRGVDRSGARVASGTYFARLESGFGSVVHKVVMTK